MKVRVKPISLMLVTVLLVLVFGITEAFTLRIQSTPPQSTPSQSTSPLYEIVMIQNSYSHDPMKTPALPATFKDQPYAAAIQFLEKMATPIMWPSPGNRCTGPDPIKKPGCYDYQFKLCGLDGCPDRQSCSLPADVSANSICTAVLQNWIYNDQKLSCRFVCQTV